MSRYQKGKTNLDFTEARDSEWQWHQLGHMQLQVCTSLLQITTPAPHHSVFTGRMPFLPPNQQRQSTEGSSCVDIYLLIFAAHVLCIAARVFKDFVNFCSYVNEFSAVFIHIDIVVNRDGNELMIGTS